MVPTAPGCSPEPVKPRRWSWLIVFVAAFLGAASPSVALQDDDLIVTEIGLGFVETANPECVPDAGGQARAFDSEHGLLCILRSEPLSAEFIELGVDVFRDPSVEQFRVGSVTPSAGVVFPGDPNPAYAVTFGAGPYLYTIFLIRSAVAAPFDEQELLIDLAERHVQLALPATERPSTPPEPDSAPATTTTAAPPIGAIGPVDPALGALLVDLPHFSRTLAPIPDAHFIDSDLASLGPVGEALSNGTSSVLQFYDAPGGLLVGVLVAEYRYPLFAAAVVGNGPALGADPSVVLAAAHRRDGMVALGAGSKPPGTAFRQGATVYLVLTTDDIPVSRQDAYDAVGALGAALYDAGPGGATSSYVFPTAATAASQTLLLVGALGAGVGLARSVSGQRARTIGRRAPGEKGMVDLTQAAAAVRRRGRILFVIQLVAIAALIVGLTVLTGPLAVATVFLALAVALAAARFVRRADLPKGLERPATRPGVAGMLLGLAALAILAAGVALLVRGARESLFRPSLAHLELADSVGIDPVLLGWAIAAVGLALLVLGASVYRLARRTGRATAERLRREDPRPEILYLRSFEDDQLPIRTTFSARRPFFESFSISGREPFESAVAWQISAYGPVVAVGQPGVRLASLGAARQHLPADEWRPRVDRLMEDAHAIVMVVGKTEGLAWEIDRVARHGHLDKTVLITPPVGDDDVRERWTRVLTILTAADVEAQPAAKPEQTIASVFGRNGAGTVYTATRRDEASYRVCVDAAMASLR